MKGKVPTIDKLLLSQNSDLVLDLNLLTKKTLGNEYHSPYPEVKQE